MMLPAVAVLLSYLFLALACVCYALLIQVLYELITAQARWQSAAAFAAAALLVLGLHYLGRRHPVPQGMGPLPAWLRLTPSFKLAGLVGSIAASLAAIFLAQHYIKFERIIATEASEWRQQTLSDGTVVSLDARTRIRVEYTREARIVHVYLGAAVFAVTKDPKRPFIARTDFADIEAVGTRFGVSIDSGVTTTVSEGTVQVTARGRGDMGVLVRAGEEFRVTRGPLTSAQVTRVDAERKLSWAVAGELVLDGLTVAEAAREFNRRNRMQIIVDSPTLAAEIIPYAIVQANSPEKYAALVARHSGVKMTVDEAKGVIRLTE